MPQSHASAGALLVRAVCALIAVAALAVTRGALAVDGLQLSIERIDGAGWRAQNLAASVSFNDEGVRAQLRIARLILPGANQRALRNVSIDCPRLETSVEAYACSNALLRVAAPGLGTQAIKANVRYGRRDGALDVKLAGLRFAPGSASVAASLRKQGWSASLSLRQVPVASLASLAKELGLAAPPIAAEAGRATLDVALRGAAGLVRELKVNGEIDELTLNNESGSLATDKLAVELDGALRRAGQDWRFAVELRSRRGQAYVQPIFFDLGVHALALSARGVARGALLRLEQFSLDHTDVAQARGRVGIDFSQAQPLRSLDLQLASLRFPGAYESYLQPLLLDTSFKSMQTAGTLAGRIQVEAGAPQSIALTLDGVSFDDGAGRFALANLSGRWAWRDATDAPARNDVDSAAARSELRWERGLLLGLELGAGELRFATHGRGFRLLAPARIPVLDGAIDLERLSINNVGAPDVAFLVDAAIQPISVERLCRAFGWPPFGGRVGGVVSQLAMREGVVTLGAALRAQVFDGAVSISDLRLEHPFGQWPRFHSTVTLDNLDLDLVTRAFSFGRITGRLSGAIRDLELFNWTPVAFDARLYTPPHDRSRHRISQRAVENIGAIGGGGAGVAAGLSSGFLRFFDDFNYDRLGLSCRLENEVCHMDGVAPAPHGGYYLVKGKGIPRIDVIGGARRVDWPRLVQQLISATRSEGPVVR